MIKLTALISILAVLGFCGAFFFYEIFIEPLTKIQGTSVIYSSAKALDKPKAILLPKDLSEDQIRLLNLAYKIAKEDGHKHPEILQGIIMQESKAGRFKEFRVAGLQNGPKDRYFGIAQIKVAAAKDVLKRNPELWAGFSTRTDEEIQAKLILDDVFNLRIASKYLLQLGVNMSKNLGITSYNQGPSGAKLVDHNNFEYTNQVNQHLSKFTQRRQ